MNVCHSSDGIVGSYVFSQYLVYLCVLSTAEQQGLTSRSEKRVNKSIWVVFTVRDPLHLHTGSHVFAYAYCSNERSRYLTWTARRPYLLWQRAENVINWWKRRKTSSEQWPTDEVMFFPLALVNLLCLSVEIDLRGYSFDSGVFLDRPLQISSRRRPACSGQLKNAAYMFNWQFVALYRGLNRRSRLSSDVKVALLWNKKFTRENTLILSLFLSLFVSFGWKTDRSSWIALNDFRYVKSLNTTATVSDEITSFTHSPVCHMVVQ